MSAAWLGLAATNVDRRNLDYLAPRSASTRAWAGVRHRSLFRSPKNDQQPTPRCTAFGTLTALHCLPRARRPVPAVDPQTFYEAIQAVDRAEGRHYAEGATTLAAMKAAKARGLLDRYEWIYDLETARARIRDNVVVFGTNWHRSMDVRDVAALPARLRLTPEDGVCRLRPGSPTDGGHLYAVSAYDVRADLWRIDQTWGDGMYWIGSDDLGVLLEVEDGEAVTFTEPAT